MWSMFWSFSLSILVVFGGWVIYFVGVLGDELWCIGIIVGSMIDGVGVFIY